jgi:SHAQKYF class myb-like DNA-binding protein
MNPFITKKNINLMKGKEPESKIEKIPSKIKLNSTETNEGLKQIKFLSKKIVSFRINKNKKNNDAKKRKDSKNGRWTLKEHIEFLNGIAIYGNDLSKININSRNSVQLRSHAQKFFKKLKKVNDEQLGINFTPNYIKNFKDMVVHIKAVNYYYDIANVFLYLSEKYEKKRAKLSYKKNYIKNNNNNNKQGNEILLNEEKNDKVGININNIENYECNNIKLDNINMDLINNFVAYSYINIVLTYNINEQLKNILILLNDINSHYIELNHVNNSTDTNKEQNHI